MKNIMIALIASVSMMLGAKAQTADSTSNKNGIQEIRIKTSAVCDMCKETIEKAMAYEKGVKGSDLDVNSKMLTVKYDPKKTSPEKIRKAVSLAGYDADDVTADPKAYDNLNPCCKKDARH